MAVQPTVASISIPKELIEPIIQAKINTAVIEALRGSETILVRAIDAAMNVKVDGHGRVTTSSYDQRGTFLEWTVGECIRNAATSAIKEAVSKYQAEIERQIAKQLASNKSVVIRQLAKSMTEGIAKTATEGWRLTVNLDVPKG